MKLIKQTKLHSETTNGNCLAACFASILEIDIESVPEFEDMGEKWFPAVTEWLETLGLYLIEWTEETNVPGFYMVCGTSPRGTLHEVIFKNGSMIHDPHPDNCGIIDFHDMWVIVPLNIASGRMF